MSYRIGIGVDFHRLIEGRKLYLGGIEIPHYKGAVGHSDADVLLHAICDAMLGAAGLGDIGKHFPDTDPSFKNIDSKILLQRTIYLIRNEKYSVENIDCTICLETPKIKTYKEQMETTIANIIGINKKNVSVKATTTEQLGFVGREEGIMAYAVVLLSQ